MRILLVLAFCFGSLASANERPNIIYINADDLGVIRAGHGCPGWWHTAGQQAGRRQDQGEVGGADSDLHWLR